MQCSVRTKICQWLYSGKSISTVRLRSSYIIKTQKLDVVKNNISKSQLCSLSTLNNGRCNTEHSKGLLRDASVTACEGRWSLFHTDQDRTTATILNMEEGAPLMVDTYSNQGFRLNNGLAVLGPIALFPRSVLSWSVSDSMQITPESLSLFYMLAPKIDLLVLGIGDRGNKFDLHLLPFMRDRGVSLEVLPTDKAVSTFNFLNEEGRSVAGAFIPPHKINLLPDDYIEALDRKKQLFEATKPVEYI